MEQLPVYVPAPGSRLGIDPGSGIVGRETRWPGVVQIDFEGNRYAAVNMPRLADRVRHAAGRGAASYPTVARLLVKETLLVPVGTWDEGLQRILLHGEAAAAQLTLWLAGYHDEVGELDDELVCTTWASAAEEEVAS